MSKRTIDDLEAEPQTNGSIDVAVRTKKEKKAKKAKKEAVPSTEAAVEDVEVDAEAAAKKAKKEKKEKRKEKKAKKEEANAATIGEPVANGTTSKDTDEVAPVVEEKRPSKEERKAAKAAKKAAAAGKDTVKPAEAAKPAAAAPKPSGASASTGDYTEHPDLAAVPQSDIDAYLEKAFISCTDPLNAPRLRPITKFNYVPIEDDQQRKSFMSMISGFSQPTAIQAAVWPYLLSGRDCIGVAETGSGKTLAFAVPAIRRICNLPLSQRKGVKVLVVSPTRELAMQSHEHIDKLAGGVGLTSVCVYGGVPKEEQRRLLRKATVVVATPGRLNDLIQEGAADLSQVEYLVLDEADRMLDRGFEEDIKKIIGGTKSVGRQTLMFTATWPPSVRDLAATFMKTPVHFTIGDNPTGDLRANIRITQTVEVMDHWGKENRLLELLRQHQSGKKATERILVFCLYKKEATRVENTLRNKGHKVAAIHGDLNQSQRTQALQAFKDGTCPLLIATDVAARGLDIPKVKLVINVTFPLTIEDYVHRIGRTGRAGETGLAITFFTDQDKANSGALINILKAANQNVPENLLKFGTTVKKKEHSVYGAFFKETDGVKAATKIKFSE
ncbi:ATP-dependent RNA helicase dbp3 [Peziza echinospora]|nr:ATP-dependent RNA helicase dbp3 [Peziza echinospora]